MRKVKLELDALQVESFATDGGAAGRGTVQGHSGVSTDCSLHWPQTCYGETCWDSCGGSCDALCGIELTRQYYNGICI